MGYMRFVGKSPSRDLLNKPSVYLLKHTFARFRKIQHNNHWGEIITVNYFGIPKGHYANEVCNSVSHYVAILALKKRLHHPLFKPFRVSLRFSSIRTLMFSLKLQSVFTITIRFCAASVRSHFLFVTYSIKCNVSSSNQSTPYTSLPLQKDDKSLVLHANYPFNPSFVEL